MVTTNAPVVVWHRDLTNPRRRTLVDIEGSVERLRSALG